MLVLRHRGEKNRAKTSQMTESLPVAKRARAEKEDIVQRLQVCVSNINVGRDVVPVNLVAKSLRLGHSDDKLNAVVSIKALNHLTPPDIQACFCGCIGIDPSYVSHIIKEFCRGKIPNDVVVVTVEGNPRVLWFAATDTNDLIVVDITTWDVFPNVKINEFSCVANHVKDRSARQTEALQELSSSIFEARHFLEDSSYLNIQDRLLCVYDVCNTI